MPAFNISLSAVISLKAAIQNNFSKSLRFSKENLWWSSVIVKLLYLGFIIILLMTLKPMVLWNFICLLILASSQFKLCIIPINMVDVNHLIYCILSNFSDIFPYFYEEKTAKINIQNPIHLFAYSLIAGTKCRWKFWRIRV